MQKFKYGEEIHVSNKKDFLTFYNAIHVATIENAKYPFICVVAPDEEKFKKGEKFGTFPWKYARKKLPDLKKDDPVIVWGSNNPTKKKRHFAKWSEDGNIVCYSNGMTSWSSEHGKLIEWEYYKIQNKENKNDNNK